MAPSRRFRGRRTSIPRKNLDRWKKLPPLADYQSLGRLTPGAIVLLEANGEQGRSPLLMWQHYGRGATYVLATATPCGGRCACLR